MNIKTLAKKLQARLIAEHPNLTLHHISINIEYVSYKAKLEITLTGSAYPKKPDGEADFDNKEGRIFISVRTIKGLSDALGQFDEKLLGIKTISQLNIEDNA